MKIPTAVNFKYVDITREQSRDFFGSFLVYQGTCFYIEYALKRFCKTIIEWLYTQKTLSKDLNDYNCRNLHFNWLYQITSAAIRISGPAWAFLAIG